MNEKLNGKDGKNEARYLTQAELAERWRCAESTVIKYRHKGVISYFQLPGSSKVLYSLDEIEKIENQNTNKKGNDKPKQPADIKRVKPCKSSDKKEWRI